MLVGEEMATGLAEDNYPVLSHVTGIMHYLDQGE